MADHLRKYESLFVLSYGLQYDQLLTPDKDLP